MKQHIKTQFLIAIWWDKYFKGFGLNPDIVKSIVYSLPVDTVMELRQYSPQVLGVKGAPLVVY